MPAGASEAQQAPSFPDTAAPLLLVCGAAFGAMSLEAAREEACALRGPGDALPCAKAMVAAVTNGRSAGEVVEQALYIEPGSPIDELLVRLPKPAPSRAEMDALLLDLRYSPVGVGAASTAHAARAAVSGTAEWVADSAGCLVTGDCKDTAAEDTGTDLLARIDTKVAEGDSDKEIPALRTTIDAAIARAAAAAVSMQAATHVAKEAVSSSIGGVSASIGSALLKASADAKVAADHTSDAAAARWVETERKDAERDVAVAQARCSQAERDALREEKRRATEAERTKARENERTRRAEEAHLAKAKAEAERAAAAAVAAVAAAAKEEAKAAEPTPLDRLSSWASRKLSGAGAASGATISVRAAQTGDSGDRSTLSQAATAAAEVALVMLVFQAVREIRERPDEATELLESAGKGISGMMQRVGALARRLARKLHKRNDAKGPPPAEANGATTNGATKVLENGHKIELALERDPPPSEEDVDVEVEVANGPTVITEAPTVEVGAE